MEKHRMLKTFKKIVSKEGRGTAIEFGLIAAVIVAVIIGALQDEGTNQSTSFTTVSGGFSGG
jgi:Flp pilus assembly pilin Flp